MMSKRCLKLSELLISLSITHIPLFFVENYQLVTNIQAFRNAGRVRDGARVRHGLVITKTGRNSSCMSNILLVPFVR